MTSCNFRIFSQAQSILKKPRRITISIVTYLLLLASISTVLAETEADHSGGKKKFIAIPKDIDNSSQGARAKSRMSIKLKGENVVKSFGLNPTKDLQLINGFALELDEANESAVGIQLAEVGMQLYPDIQIKATYTPSDTYWNLQADMRLMSLDTAWDTQLGSPSVEVAVIDTGVSYAHPDLSPNMSNIGFNFISNTSGVVAADDDHYHGTHVAGTIAAKDNSYGVIGVAPHVRIVPLKVLDANGSGDLSSVISAIQFVILQNQQGHNIRVMNASLGGYGGCDTPMQAAIDAAYNSGVLFVAAAGNDGVNASGATPGNCNHTMTVAAVDNDGNLTSFSNYGASVEVAAPGDEIPGTIPGNSFGYLSGTSMATPHVAGLAALLWSNYPSETISTIWNRIVNSVSTRSALNGFVTSGGIVNAAYALNIEPQTPTSFSVSGAVVDSSNALIAGAAISSNCGTTTTDSNGAYAIHSIATGTTCSITAAISGFSCTTVAPLVEGANSANNNVQCQINGKPLSVTVTVKKKTGKKSKALQNGITTVSIHATGTTIATGNTNSKGKVKLGRLPKGVGLLLSVDGIARKQFTLKKNASTSVSY